MKKYFGIISSIFVLSLFLLPNAFIKAQSLKIPNVYVQNITLQRSDLKAGEIVSGTFEALTDAPVLASDIYFTISLAGEYKENTLAGVFYDSTTTPISYNIKAGEIKIVNFSYVIPQVKTGTGYGIQIQGKTRAGIPLGWSDALIKITNDGNAQYLDVVDAKLNVGTDSFRLQEGPMVPVGKNAVLNIIIKNSTSQSVTITPNIDLYDHVVLGAPIKTVTASPVTIDAGKQKEISVTLPTDNNRPLVYVSRISFLDTNKVQRLTAIDARYIVQGDIATIHTVSTDKKFFSKGDTVAVTLGFSGTPLDVITGKQQADAVYDTAINLLDKKGKIVAAWSGLIDYNDASAKTITMTAAAKANGYTVDVSVTKAGKTITHYSTETESDSAQTQINWLFVIGGAILIGIIVIIHTFLLRRNKKAVTVALFLFIFAGLSCVIFNYPTIKKAEAQAPPITEYWTPESKTNHIIPTISAPSKSVFNRGETITVSGTGEYKVECTNDGVQVRAYATLVNSAGQTVIDTRPDRSPFVVYTKEQLKTFEWGEMFVPRWSERSNPYIISFSAPAVPGVYTLHRYIHTNSYGTDWTYEGVQTITVVGPQCTGPDPLHATQCAGDGAWLLSNTPKVIVNACTVPTMCEYKCNIGKIVREHITPGYKLVGGQCVPAECLNRPSNATICRSSDDTGLPYDVESTLVSGISYCPSFRSRDNLSACVFYCASPYVKVGNTCVDPNQPPPPPPPPPDGPTPPPPGDPGLPPSGDPGDTVSCNPVTSVSAPNPATFANVGELVTWTSTVSGTWSGDGVVGDPTGVTYATRYSTIGNKTVSVEVDGTDHSCTTSVNGLPNGLPIINNPDIRPF